MIKYAVMILLALAGFTSYTNGRHEGYFIYFLRQSLILCSIIPICMRINLDLAKIYFTHLITTDSDLHGARTHNSKAVEELGRIQYLVTDKTGTLTSNLMGLKKLCTEFAIFDEDDPNNDLGDILKENVDKHPQGAGNDEDQTGGPDRDKGNNVRDLITAFTICNNVTPLFKDPAADKALGDLHYNRVSKVNESLV